MKRSETKKCLKLSTIPLCTTNVLIFSFPYVLYIRPRIIFAQKQVYSVIYFSHLAIYCFKSVPEYITEESSNVKIQRVPPRESLPREPAPPIQPLRPELLSGDNTALNIFLHLQCALVSLEWHGAAESLSQNPCLFFILINTSNCSQNRCTDWLSPNQNSCFPTSANI